jgi:hypothetical protein
LLSRGAITLIFKKAMTMTFKKDVCFHEGHELGHEDNSTFMRALTLAVKRDLTLTFCDLGLRLSIYAIYIQGFKSCIFVIALAVSLFLYREVICCCIKK